MLGEQRGEHTHPGRVPDLRGLKTRQLQYVPELGGKGLARLQPGGQHIKGGAAYISGQHHLTSAPLQQCGNERTGGALAFATGDRHGARQCAPSGRLRKPHLSTPCTYDVGVLFQQLVQSPMMWRYSR